MNKKKFEQIRKFLVKQLNGFKEENCKAQRIMIRLLFECYPCHKDYEKAYMFTQNYFENFNASKKTFLKINSKYQLFYTNGRYKIHDTAKPYWLTNQSKNIILDYFKYKKSKRMKNKPIKFNNAKKSCDSENSFTIKRNVPINLDNLYQQVDYEEDIDTQIEMAKIAIATDDSAETIKQKYKRLPCGRLTCQSLPNFQIVKKATRRAIFKGCYVYDIKNSHYSVANKVSQDHQLSCDHIKHYSEHSEEIRNRLSRDVNVSYDQIKTCLLALLYGAKRQAFHFSSIYHELGRDEATTQCFLDHDFVKGLTKDIDKLVPILTTLSDTKYEGNKHSVAAQTLMEIEASILDTMMEGHTVLLPLFDGFISSDYSDTDSMQKRINKNHNIDIQVERKVY